MMGNKRISRTFFVCIMAAACAFPAYATKTDVDAAKDKMTALEEEKQKVEKTLKGLESLKQDAAAYVRELDSSLESLGKELDQLSGQITEKEREIEVAKADLESAKQVENEQYEAMKLRIKYMYEKGETSYIDMLLQSQSFSELLSRAEYISKILEYDRSKMDEYAAVKEGIAEKEKALEAEHVELLSMEEATKAKQASVEKLMEEKTAELKNFETKIASAQGEVDEYERDIKAQEDKIAQIEAEIKRKEEEARKAAEASGQKYNTVSIGNINFVWPCPSSFRVTSDFGGRSSPTEGASTNHKGMDIGASSGSDIVAAASGEVIISTYSYSAGNYIMISHGGGVYTVYMHCSQLLASVGQQVSQGQVIAKVGSTGYSTGSHLHFGIRVGGSYVNPANYVSP